METKTIFESKRPPHTVTDRHSQQVRLLIASTVKTIYWSSRRWPPRKKKETLFAALISLWFFVFPVYKRHKKKRSLSPLFLVNVVNSVNGTLSRLNTNQSRERSQTRTVIEDNRIRKQNRKNNKNRSSYSDQQQDSTHSIMCYSCARIYTPSASTYNKTTDRRRDATTPPFLSFTPRPADTGLPISLLLSPHLSSVMWALHTDRLYLETLETENRT